jgi:hypothetical protein
MHLCFSIFDGFSTLELRFALSTSLILALFAYVLKLVRYPAGIRLGGNVYKLPGRLLI